MFKRILNPQLLIDKKSFFLLGPRQTGKSTLLKNALPNALYLNLLEMDKYRLLVTYPERLRNLIEDNKIIIIDEIQQIPELLNEIQLLIDNDNGLKFILTGSSARKLKRGNANLLGGRAWVYNLWPLVYSECPDVSFETRLKYGSMPGVLTSEDANFELFNYVGTYLKEEIYAEGLARSVGSFSRFLEVAALSNTEQLNYSNISSDVGIPMRTVKDHFQILEDTLIASLLPIFKKSKKRKTVSSSKLYFFDLGVVNILQCKKIIEDNQLLLGKRFEQLIYQELKTYISYKLPYSELTYWRTTDGNEVDFLIDSQYAIEIKAKDTLRNKDFDSLNLLSEEFPKIKKIIITLNDTYQKHDSIDIMSAKTFLEKLWSDKFIII